MIINSVVTNIQTGGRVLPAEYTACEWIGSSGTQYIDTGYKPNQFTSVRLCYQFTAIPSSSGTYHALFGTDVSGVAEAYFSIITNNSRAYCRQNYNSNYSYYSPNISDQPIVVFGGGNDGMSDLSHTEMYRLYNNGVYNPYLYDNSANLTLYLFALNSSNTAIWNCSAKIFFCQIFDNSTGELMRDFVPCYKTENGVDIIGLYDFVGGQFYTNAGTGTFTKGADV